jgi:hypothetical protein
MNKKETKKLDTMSEEQYKFYEMIQQGYNVIGDACAGSGKSTTILSIATKMPEKKFVQFTYNSMLCNEIKGKIDDYGIENLKVYTYHSMVVKFYSSEDYTDSVIRRVLHRNQPPRIAIPPFDIIVIDEAQDMTFLYFRIVVKFCKDIGRKIQLLILGDYMQGLYDFKGADTRFLTHADKLWEEFPLLQSKEFHKLSLKTSYRITHQMADFVNNILLGEARLLACKEGTQVVYLRRNNVQTEKYIIHKIKQLLLNGAKPSDIFVLGSSVKGERSQIRKLENVLVEHNIPCYVPLVENDKLDERVSEGKVVFSTFHSVKGRQRRFVFIVGFDNTYFKYYAKNLPPGECPNTLYVATTRATEGLYVVEKQSSSPVPFLKMNHIQIKNEPYMDFQGIPQTVFQEDNLEQKPELQLHITTPTDIIKFIPESIIEEISPLIERIFIRIENKKTELDIQSLVKTRRGYHEDVSDLNGITIPIMFFERMLENIEKVPDIREPSAKGGRVLHRIIETNMMDVKPQEHRFLKKMIDKMPDNCVTIEDYLYMSNLYVASKEKLYFKLNQIDRDEYDWLSEDAVNQCFRRLYNELYIECCLNTSNIFQAEIEKTFIKSYDEQAHAKIDDVLRQHFPGELFRFTARADLVSDYTLWEIKCTNTISNEHLIQVVIYAWLWRLSMEDMENLENIVDFKIFNIKSGEIYRLEATTDELTQIVVAILKGKYLKPDLKEDSEFISDCRGTYGIGESRL